MNFGFIKTSDCVPGIGGTPGPGGPTDPRCSDAAFAIANPDICPAQTELILKPSVALTCALGSVQYRAFNVTNGVEVDVTSECIFATSNMNIALIGAISGNCTGVSQGEATISATRKGITAVATLTVMGNTGGSGHCCDNEKVAMMVMVDTSWSMSQTFASGNYSTRLDFAKAAATRFISEVNATKDIVGLLSFNLAGILPLSSPVADNASVEAMVSDIAQTQQKTEFYNALSEAILELNDATADLRVIVLISDGEDTSPAAGNAYDGANNPITLLSNFRDSGGIVICLGCRASGSGFARLSEFSTGGFFINAYPGIESDSLDFLSGLKGYICAGNCTPEGDVMVGTGQLNYDAFTNWTVTDGHVDLIGPGLFDFLPGNGLYVDLAGSTLAAYGKMTSKNSFSLTAGHTYRLSVQLAGNQRLDASPYSAVVRVFVRVFYGTAEPELLRQTIVINDYSQDFADYSFSFTAPSDVDAYISIQENAVPASLTGIEPFFGLLLGKVQFEDTTDLVNLLTDNFDTENTQYVPPRCGLGTTFISGGYATGTNCYGTGCLTDPPQTQVPDPVPLTDIESGYTPPTQFTSTQHACAGCDPGYVNRTTTPLAATVVAYAPTGTDPNPVSLIPVMTGPTTPSGLADASSEQVTVNLGTEYAWRAFGVVDVPWAPTSLPAWLRYTFPTAKTVIAYGIVAGAATDPAGLRDWQFQGSNDGNTWTTLDSQVGNDTVGYGSETKFFLSAPASFTQYRLYITNTFGNDVPTIFLLKMYGASTPVTVPYYTSQTLDLGSSVVVAAYDLTCAYSDAPIDGWVVQGSNDLSTWDTLSTIYAPPFNAFSNTPQMGTFPLMIGTAYRYYKFTVTPRGDSVATGFNNLALYALADSQECADATRTGNSQPAADRAAYSAALVLAQAKLNCQQLFMATVTHKASCPVGTYGGADVQRTATAYSFFSQDHATKEADKAAQIAAEAALNCSQSNNFQAVTIVDLPAGATGGKPSVPYGTVKLVTSAITSLSSVQVKLYGLSHTSLEDVVMLLRAPDGTCVALMQFGNIGVNMLNTRVSNISITIADGGTAWTTPTTVPTDIPVDGGTYKPYAFAIHTLGSSFPAPFPTQTVDPETTLSALAGKDPNGAWSLWIVDAKYLDSGVLAHGWDLVIT